MAKYINSEFKPGISPDNHAVINSFTRLQYFLQQKSKELYMMLHDVLTTRGKTFKSPYKITHNDFFNLIRFDEINKIRLLEKFLPEGYLVKNTITKEGLSYISEVVQEAYNFYEQFLLRTFDKTFLYKWKKGNTIKFNNTDEVMQFLEVTTSEYNKPSIKQMSCSLLKIMYSVNYMKQHPKIAEKEKKFENLVSQHILPQFNFKDKKLSAEDINAKKHDNLELITKSEISNSKAIYFKSSGRVKDDWKILVKLIGNPEYNELEAIKDINGLRFEVQTIEDGIKLLEYVTKYVFKNKGKIKNKKFTTHEQAEAMSGSLDPQFFSMLMSSLSPTGRPGKNNEKYQDIKITGLLEGEEVEVQIVLVNNKNESGYAHHGIYDCIKIIEALVRLQGYITEVMLERYITFTLSYYKKDLEHFNVKNIFDYFVEEGTVAKLSIPDQANKKYYTTPERRNEFHKEGLEELYPDGAQLFFNNKRTTEKVSL